MSMSENVSTANSNFVGTLVRRQFKPGQPYVQLVFESSGRTLLALSRNVTLVQSLKLGGKYRIGGAEHTVSGKQYLLEPRLVPVPAKRQVSRRARYAAWAAGGVLLLASGGVVAGLSLQGGDAPKASSSPWHAGNTTEESVTVTAQTEKTTPAATTTPATTTTKPATSTKPKSTTTPQPIVPSNTQQPTPTPAAPIVAPPVDDCEFVTVAFASTTVIDDDQPEGTIVTPGQNGQNKVCYPNGRDAASTTEVITAPVTQVTTVHTPV